MIKKATNKGAVKKLQSIAAVIGALGAIIGALTATSSWVSGKFAEAVSEQISEFREESRELDIKHEQAITRLELSNLMRDDPYNTLAIEKMARYYFRELDGDLYMTQKYSDWAKQYNGDVTIIVGGN